MEIKLLEIHPKLCFFFYCDAAEFKNNCNQKICKEKLRTQISILRGIVQNSGILKSILSIFYFLVTTIAIKFPQSLQQLLRILHLNHLLKRTKQLYGEPNSVRILKENLLQIGKVMKNNVTQRKSHQIWFQCKDQMKEILMNRKIPL